MADDIRALDLNLLKALDALLVERSVTRAAERLGLTQPAVSGMLARLRTTFDDPLFARARHGIVPTARAEALAAPLRELIAGVEALVQPPGFDPATAAFTFSIAATDYAQQTIVVPFMARVRAAAPGIRLSVRSVAERALMPAFEQGTVDLALVSPDSAPPSLQSRWLYDETYVLAMREGHPVAGANSIDLDLFCALDHALVSLAGDPFHGVTDTELARLGRQRQVACSVGCFLVLAEVLRQSDMVAMVPQRLLERSAGLVGREAPVSVPGFAKLAVWHERHQRDPAHQWLRGLLAGMYA
ncbi:MAG TPA: LysR family transcriptional regulator [Novosphingobium sp.]|nr:LysR family transcriptional regulator [Novosphingobium sp.]